MDKEQRINELEMMREQAARDAILQEKMLNQARERMAEIQGRINELQESSEVKKK